jgi:hypothetical protein
MIRGLCYIAVFAVLTDAGSAQKIQVNQNNRAIAIFESMI